MPSRYWVGGTASWDATAGTKWAETSGGAGGFSVPTISDDVFFDADVILDLLGVLWPYHKVDVAVENYFCMIFCCSSKKSDVYVSRAIPCLKRSLIGDFDIK